MSESQPTQTIDALTADRDQWKARALGMLEVLNEVEAVVDMRWPDGTRVVFSLEWVRAYNAMCAAFNAWRQLVEGGVPTDWQVAGEEGEQGFELSDEDVPF